MSTDRLRDFPPNMQSVLCDKENAPQEGIIGKYSKTSCKRQVLGASSKKSTPLAEITNQSLAPESFIEQISLDIGREVTKAYGKLFRPLLNSIEIYEQEVKNSDDALQELKVLHEKIADLKAANIRLEDEVQKKSESISALKATVSQTHAAKDQDLAAEKDRSRELEKKLETALSCRQGQSSQDVEGAANEELIQRLADAEARAKEIGEELQEALERASEAEAQLINAEMNEEDNQEEMQKLEEVEGNLKTVEGKLKKTELELEKARGMVEEFQRKLKSSEENLQAAEEKVTILQQTGQALELAQQELGVTEEKLKDAEQCTKLAEQRTAAAEGEAAKALRELSRVGREMKTKADEAKELRVKLVQAEALVVVKDKKCNMMRIELETTKSLVTSLKDEKRKLQANLEKLSTSGTQASLTSSPKSQPEFKKPKTPARNKFKKPAPPSRIKSTPIQTTNNPRAASTSPVRPAAWKKSVRSGGLKPPTSIGMASPLTPKENPKRIRLTESASISNPFKPAEGVKATSSPPFTTPETTKPPLPMDKSLIKALKNDFLRTAEIMKVVEKDSDWKLRMKAMGVLKTLIVDKRITEYKMWSVTLRKKFKKVMAIQIEDLRSSIIKEACNLLVQTADVMGSRFTELFKYFIPKLMKLLYVTIKIISETAYDTLKKITSRVGSLDLVPLLKQAAVTDDHPQVRHRSLECIHVLLGKGGMWNLKLSATPPSTKAILTARSDVETAMLKCLGDADTTVRAESRNLFSTFKATWPELAASLFEEMAPETQRAIKRAEKAASTSSQRKRKKGFKKPKSNYGTWSSGMLTSALQSARSSRQ